MSNDLRYAVSKMAYARREARSLADLPPGSLWLILVEDTYVPYSGYENEPGGVSSPTPYLRVFAYTTRKEWEADITALVAAGAECSKQWRAMTIEQAHVDITVKVTIK